ncbi:hypothetical protein MP478_12400 [Chryseobacterium sp. WG14]|uniref:hypothetical protein n=1 Tax=Chryseobacterium sp. WG14 TaxID=2926909 RepID=UPI00211E23AC|nr:hypothetical protein [Chryseobacterium sp. WG14]MCQ9640181.1 hypothetical protein [Chryseobacterium sp. WG14]
MENIYSELKISEIKNLIHGLLGELNKLDNAGAITLREDLYWNILEGELYNSYEEPKGLTMGSLKEDWEFLQKVVKGEREIIDYDLCKLASVLRFLGNKCILLQNKVL